MASVTEVNKLVQTLCEAHGRKRSDELLDAYAIALAEFADADISCALTVALRERREFMPPPGIVAAFAKDCRISRERPPADERRVVCSVCHDAGHVLIVNREWLGAHGNLIARKWLVEGWIREASEWCRRNIEGSGSSNGHKAFLIPAICFCKCYNARNYWEQLRRYLDAKQAGGVEADRVPAPTFARMFDPRSDCLVHARERAEVEAALLDWRAQATAAQTSIPF